MEGRLGVHPAMNLFLYVNLDMPGISRERASGFPVRQGKGASSASPPLRKATFLPLHHVHSHQNRRSIPTLPTLTLSTLAWILFPIPQGIYKTTMTVITHDHCFWIPLFPRHYMVLGDIKSVIVMTSCSIIVDRFICSAQRVSAQLLLSVLRTAKIIPKITEVLSIHRCFSFKVKLLWSYSVKACNQSSA